MQSVNNLRLQAMIFGKYLIGEAPCESAIKLYIKTIIEPSLPKNEQRIFNLVLRYNWLLGFIDAGYALTKPDAELRRRIYIMFAILESMPDHHEKFLLAKPQPFLKLVTMVIEAGFKTAVGVIITKAVR